MTNPESTAIDPVAAMGTDHTEAPAHPLHKVLSFVRRSGRLDDRLQRAWDNYAGTYLLDIAAGNLLDVREGVTLDRAFVESAWGNDNPLIVEIGTGQGENVAAAAAARPETNFLALKAGFVDCIETHTCTVTEFLQATSEPISRFVLLDHMDWMSCYYPEALLEEWQAIVNRAAPGARILLRSAHAKPPFLDWIQARVGVEPKPLHEIVDFEPALAERLQLEDRVHTYAGFVIAQLKDHGSL